MIEWKYEDDTINSQPAINCRVVRSDRLYSLSFALINDGVGYEEARRLFDQIDELLSRFSCARTPKPQQSTLRPVGDDLSAALKHMREGSGL